MAIASDLLRLLSPRERRGLYLLSPLLCLTALLEVAGIASIMPFLAIVADPGAIERHETLSWLYRVGGFSDSRQFLIAVGVLMFSFVVASNALTATTTWAVLRFSWLRNHTIAVRFLQGYLARPYSFFLQRHSSDLGKNVVAEVQNVVSGVIVPAMQVVAKSIAAVAVMLLLCFIDPLLAVLTGIVLGGSYSLTYLATRRQQRLIGRQRLAANKDRFEILAEVFGGIKEIKLLGREEEIVRRFEAPSYRFAISAVRNAIAAQLPRFGLEAIAFGGIVLMVLYLLGTGQRFQEILPILGLYAFAGYRLMPALQQIFLAVTTIRFNVAALEHLLEDLPSVPAEPLEERSAPPVPLRESIRLEGVTFCYPTAKAPLFSGLDLEILAGTSVGFVGATGSGKSTLVDLVLGLLRPDQGRIVVDGVALTDENVRGWQRTIGYVPQAIFLANDTVARNIAFGLPDEEIDFDAVVRAAEAAAIDSFVEHELPEGYSTVVGERGVRLSGGQRQRIGIARALYRDPQVIVFDEATSSLDTVTEEVILQSIAGLARTRTILAVAHRLSTVRSCDRILFLEAGKIVATGTYDQLLTSSPGFRALAGAAVEK